MVRKLSVKHPAAFLRYMRNLRMEQTEREKKEQAYITQLKKNMNPEDVAGPVSYTHLTLPTNSRV